MSAIYGFCMANGVPSWENKLEVVNGNASVDCVHGVGRARGGQDERCLADRRAVENARKATRLLRLDGIEFMEMTIWSRTGSTITIWDGRGSMNFGQ
jgi:hypothetical protein